MRLALAAAVALASLPSPVLADTLVDNVDGMTLAADGTLQRFAGLLIDDNGRVQQLFQRGEKRPLRVDYRLDGKGRVLMPGLIDSNVELMRLALSRIAPAAPGARPRPEDRDQALIEVQKQLVERGITTVVDMGTTIEDWQTYRRAGDLGTLTVRILAYAADVDNLVLIAGSRPTPWLYDDRLHCNGLRIGFAAATAPPVQARPGRVPARAPEPTIQLKNLLSRAGIDGFQAAVSLRDTASLPPLLDAIGELSQTYKGERRWRIDLPVMPGEAELARMAQGGMALAITPTALATPPAGRLRYALGSLPAEPFAHFSATLRREDALAAQTSRAAWTAFADGKMGRIAIGQRADFVLVDRDPMLASQAELRSIRVMQTWIGGKMAFRSKDDAPPSPAAATR